jgi:hypothetical protein
MRWYSCLNTSNNAHGEADYGGKYISGLTQGDGTEHHTAPALHTRSISIYEHCFVLSPAMEGLR